MKKALVNIVFAIGIMLLLAVGVSAADNGHRVFTQAELQGQVPLDNEISTEVQDFDRFGGLNGFEKVYEIEGVAAGQSVDYYLPSKSGFLLLTSPTNSTLSRTIFSAGNNNAHINQKWRFTPDSSGDYVIYSCAYPTKCLTINYITLEVTLSEYTGSQFQKWGIYSGANGFTLVSEAVSQTNGFKLVYGSSGFSVHYSQYEPLYFFNANTFVPTERVIIEDLVVGQEMSVIAKATIIPENATIKPYSGLGGWSYHSAHGFFTSTTQGRVTGIRNGTHYLMYSDPMTKNSYTCMVTVIDNNESILNKFEDLYDLALAFSNSDEEEATLLSLQFVRRGKYNEGFWPTVAGTINTNFTTYVSTQNNSLSQFFTIEEGEELFFMDCDYNVIDFPHLCATLNGLLYDSTGFLAFMAGEANIDNLCGWAGDLQTLCQEVINYTNDSNSYSEIYDATLYLLGADAPFSKEDLLADTDSYNIMNMINDSYTNTISSFVTYYSEDYVTRFSDFTNGWSWNQIYNCVRIYTDDEFVLWVDWPILDEVEISSTQADAIAEAFTDYVWEEIQNETDE